MAITCEVFIEEEPIEEILLIPAGPVATNEKYNSFVPTLGQTVFTLSDIPTIPSLSRLFVNGVQRAFIRHYTISGSQLTYLDNGYPLDPDDDLDFYFI